MCDLERALRAYDGFFCCMSARYDGAELLLLWWRRQAILKVILTLTGSQLIDFGCLVVLDDFGRRKIARAAWFCIRCEWDVAS